MNGTTNNNNSILPTNQGLLCNKNMSNIKLSFCDSFPFRGFSENEITTIHDNIKNADSTKHLLNNHPKDWLDKNNKYQTSFYRQYPFEKKYPIKIDTTESRLSCSSHQADTCSLKTHKNEAITDFCHTKTRQSDNVKHQSEKHENNIFDKDKKSGISQTIIDVRPNEVIKQTIKDDICQMDVLSDGDQDVVVNADDLLAITRDRLKGSLSNFLKRAQEGIVIELSPFPRIKSYPQMDASNSTRVTLKERKSETPDEEKDFASNVSNSDSHLLSKRQKANINILGEKPRVPDEKLPGKANQKAFNYQATKLQVKDNPQELGKALELQKNNNSESTAIERKQDDGEKFLYKTTRPNDANSEKDFQARSMSELAAYKKQYYDTLLNIQRAKVAVTNSLACSPDHLTAYNDPYYANYMCQQKHLFHQQRHFAVRPQFSPCPTALSGLSSTHSNQYNWTRSDCKYLLLKQLRFQQQASPLCTRENGWIHSYIGPVYPCPFTLNGDGQTKHCVRRKNLENLVGKLKETERSDVDN